MVKSMTGFGRSEYTDEKRSIIVEIKCSNKRVEKQIKEDFEMMKRIYEVR